MYIDIENTNALNDVELHYVLAALQKEAAKRKMEASLRAPYEQDPQLLLVETIGWEEGYACGYTWPDAWETHGKPGGPWSFNANGYDKPEYHMKARRSQNRRSRWLEGWAVGHQHKLERKLSFSIDDQHRASPCGDTCIKLGLL